MVEYRPVGDWIRVIPDKPKMTRAGIHLPESGSGQPSKFFPGTGTVVAVGPGKMHPAHMELVPMSCKAGDRILFWIQASNYFKPHEEELCMIQDEQVVAVVKGEAEYN